MTNPEIMKVGVAPGRYNANMCGSDKEASEDLLRLEICPQCAHSLRGLELEGRCPECGHAYDQETVYLYGWAHGQHVNIGNCSRWEMVVRAILGIALVGMLTRSLIHESRPAMYVVMTPIFVLYGLGKLTSRFATRHPGLVQVCIGPAGCGHLDDLAPPSPAVDLLANLTRLCLSLAVPYLVYAAVCEPAIRWTAIAWAAFLSIPLVLWARARFASQRIGGTNGGEDSQTEQLLPIVPPTPWRLIDKVVIRKTRNGLYRLRLRGKDEDSIDASVICTDQQAEELRRRVNVWMSAAGEEEAQSATAPHAAKDRDATPAPLPSGNPSPIARSDQ